jgi:hypothetical protein
MRNQKKKTPNPRQLPRVRPAEARKAKELKRKEKDAS